MNNSSTLTANFSNYKLLSALFLFVFLSFAQTASAQTHVIILRGNENPNEISEMICANSGGVFNPVLENNGNEAMTNVMMTITMVNGKTNIASVHYIGTINVNSIGGTNFSIPTNFPSNYGYFLIEVSYDLSRQHVTINQKVPFDLGCEN